MHHTARHVRAGGGPAVDRGGDGVDREPGLHPIRDGVAHDPVGVDVLDRAQIELALGGGVLGDVGQPQLVRLGGGEVPFDPVVVDRRAGPFAVLAAFHPERGPPVLVAADPHTVRSQPLWPAARAPSASSRCPNSGSSTWASNTAFANWARLRSRGPTGRAGQR